LVGGRVVRVLVPPEAGVGSGRDGGPDRPEIGVPNCDLREGDLLEQAELLPLLEEIGEVARGEAADDEIRLGLADLEDIGAADRRAAPRRGEDTRAPARERSSSSSSLMLARKVRARFLMLGYGRARHPVN
jgi:hypothetical protein